MRKVSNDINNINNFNVNNAIDMLKILQNNEEYLEKLVIDKDEDKDIDEDIDKDKDIILTSSIEELQNKFFESLKNYEDNYKKFNSDDEYDDEEMSQEMYENMYNLLCKVKYTKKTF
jgi:hypothetical protein